ncbi:MMPL family transporter [Streptomyces sp. NPDC052496]|uniref:MMPL family transporter n=1 Tax=Streptomyces sp. NPDC052496 TaxID=3154951 RepID=UPI003446A616
MRRAWLVVTGAVVAMVCAGVLAPAAFEALSTGGAAYTGSEAHRARREAERLGVPCPDLLLALSTRATDNSSIPAQDAARVVVEKLSRRPDVRTAWSAATADDPWLRSKDGRTLLVAVQLEGTAKERSDTAPRVVADARSAAPSSRVEPSGEVWANREIDEAIERDARRAELLAAPVIFAVLVFAYGSVVSAVLPVVVAALAVGCSLPVLGALTQVIDVSRTAASAASAIGLGLAVDYSLFLLARVREETARGATPEAALSGALRSAGHSVAVSAAAITACAAAAMVVPVPLLRGLCVAAMVVPVMAAVAALTVVPACLRLLGPRAHAWDPLARWRRTRTGDKSPFWQGAAQAVTARPLLSGALVTLLLVLMATPVVHVRLGQVDERALPASAQAAAIAARVRADFAVPPDRVLTAVVTGPRAADGARAYGDRLAGLPDVTGVRVVRADPREQAAVVTVAGSPAPDSQAADDLVRTIRDTPAPGRASVGGQAAQITDTTNAVAEALPASLLIMAAALMLLLGFYTRTVVAPLKALAVAAISLGASFGVIVLVFQDGHGAALLGGMTATGALDVSGLLFALFITLGLSVDYEVFLLGRIREEYLRHGDNRTAITDGIGRTGRLMTAAATAVAISTAAMGTSDVAVLKLIGIGLAFGALMDAVLVRGVLVPAVMAALGPLNWWLPGRRAVPPPPTAKAPEDEG